MIEPTEDEFQTRGSSIRSAMYVAEAYRIAADKQRAEWDRHFDLNLIPADIATTRLVLKTREDAYRSFLENTLADYIAIVDPEGRSAWSKTSQARARHAAAKSLAEKIDTPCSRQAVPALNEEARPAYVWVLGADGWEACAYVVFANGVRKADGQHPPAFNSLERAVDMTVSAVKRAWPDHAKPPET